MLHDLGQRHLDLVVLGGDLDHARPRGLAEVVNGRRHAMVAQRHERATGAHQAVKALLHLERERPGHGVGLLAGRLNIR
ncbi:hypothetical protein D3C78_1557440 [compost metagenome]